MFTGERNLRNSHRQQYSELVCTTSIRFTFFENQLKLSTKLTKGSSGTEDLVFNILLIIFRHAKIQNCFYFYTTLNVLKLI